MELRRGQVVRSKAGRDKGSFLAVLALEPPYAVLGAGKKRPLERPKRKKLAHLAPTGALLPEEALTTNRKLRAALGAAAPGARPGEADETGDDAQKSKALP